MLNDKYFQKYLDMCDGNIFAATNLVANLARKLCKRYNNVVLESEAIHWILSGEKPKIVDELGQIRYKYRTKKLSPLTDILCNIDDEEIKAAVQASFTESKKRQDLTYLYNNIVDEYAQARVRILVRMLWYKYNDERRL